MSEHDGNDGRCKKCGSNLDYCPYPLGCDKQWCKNCDWKACSNCEKAESREDCGRYIDGKYKCGRCVEYIDDVKRRMARAEAKLEAACRSYDEQTLSDDEDPV